MFKKLDTEKMKAKKKNAETEPAPRRDACHCTCDGKNHMGNSLDAAMVTGG